MRRGATGSAQLLEERGVDALFVAPSSDLEYLTGLERDLPSFGNISYAHGWVTGAFLAPDGSRSSCCRGCSSTSTSSGRAPPASSWSRRPTTAARSFAKAVAQPREPQHDRASARGRGAETVIELRARCPAPSCVNGSPLVNELRRVKSTAELELMTHACSIARRRRWPRSRRGRSPA